MNERGNGTAIRACRLTFAALGAAVLLAAAATPQALALDTGWRRTCTFPSAPQGYNDMMRERVCIIMNDCQARADALGSPVTGGACIAVPPSTTQDGLAHTR